jgi:LytS/YehU family sensor histidine kinase
VRWYYRRKIKLISAQRQRLEEQLTTIQSQLNPHFIFNALSSIEGLVASGQNKLANEYLSNFSMIMRETLKNADKLLISLKEEINLLEKFKFSWQIDPEIPTEEVQVPPMLAQPLIENAVKHGAAANGTLTLSITRQQNNMLIKITNNKATNSSKLKTAGGYGWAFTRQRLKHFSALHSQTPIEFDFAEKETHFEATLRFINWFA